MKKEEKKRTKQVNKGGLIWRQVGDLGMRIAFSSLVVWQRAVTDS